MYHGIPRRHSRLRHLYSGFVSAGDLVFDVGAHAGNRTRAFRALGCRVVALEPQPDFARLLRALFGRVTEVEIIEAAVAESVGHTILSVSESTPTMTTIDSDWRKARMCEPLFSGVCWNQAVEAKTTTLDALIERYGIPMFVKIDVEGAEHRVLAGLTRPLPALSFEYLPGALDHVRTCVNRVTELGPYRFNWSVGESYQMAAPDWLKGTDLCAALDIPSTRTRSGDVYARIDPRNSDASV